MVLWPTQDHNPNGISIGSAVFGRPFVKRFALCYRAVVLSVLFCPVCDVGVLWPNGWMIKMKLGMEVGLGPGQIVLDGDSAPPKKRAHTALPPILSPCPLGPNGWRDEDAIWYLIWK